MLISHGIIIALWIVYIIFSIWLFTVTRSTGDAPYVWLIIGFVGIFAIIGTGFMGAIGLLEQWYRDKPDVSSKETPKETVPI